MEPIEDDVHQPRPPNIAGECINFNDKGQFVYRYSCEGCGRLFQQTCPEVSAPAVCHSCFLRGTRKKAEVRVIDDNEADLAPEHPANLAAGG